jgi:hypothetical protein
MNHQIKRIPLLLSDPSPALGFKLMPNLPHQLPAWHIEMLGDTKRLEFYANNLKKIVSDKIVLDLGAGTGVLSYLCLKFGAKKVISIEKNDVISEIYEEFMSEWIQEGRATLIKGDILSLQEISFERPDLIIHELFGPDGFSEDILGIIEKISSFEVLKEAPLFPNQFSLNIQFCTSMESDHSRLNDFEGFPLSRLTPLVDAYPRYISHRQFLDFKFKPLGERIEYQTFTITNKQITLVPIEITVPAGATHLMVSLEIKGEEGEHLSSDFFKGYSHWPNSMIKLPHKEKVTLVARLDGKIFRYTVV